MAMVVKFSVFSDAMFPDIGGSGSSARTSSLAISSAVLSDSEPAERDAATLVSTVVSAVVVSVAGSVFSAFSTGGSAKLNATPEDGLPFAASATLVKLNKVITTVTANERGDLNMAIQK
ncbi:MAG: hypothetical protein WBA76_01910 [Phormidesmis sp.]